MKKASCLRSLRPVLFSLMLAAWLCALTAAQSDQSGNQQDDHSDFFDSIAKTVYAMAWPTATYKGWHLELPIRDKDGGIDIVVRFYGQSSMPLEDEIWVDIAFAFRSWNLDHVLVVGNNAVWVPPFKTTSLLGGAMVQAFADYQKSHSAQPAQTSPPAESPSPAPTTIAPAPYAPATAPSEPDAPAAAVAVCVENQMNQPVNYSYRWDTLDWKQDKLDPGMAWVYTYKLGTAQSAGPQFFIAYDDSFDSNYTTRQYTLDRNTVTLPASCDTATQYAFTLSGRLIVLNANSTPTAPTQDATSTTNPSSSASPATLAAVCIENPTTLQLYYTYRWGTEGWKLDHIAPGTYVLYTLPAGTGLADVPQFSIDYPNGTQTGSTMQSTNLDTNIVASPGDCRGAKQYLFSGNAESLVLKSGN